MKIIYTVMAYKWGNKTLHTYLVGVYTKKAKAIRAAEEEEDARGHKYGCEVTERELDILFWSVPKPTYEVKLVREMSPKTVKLQS